MVWYFANIKPMEYTFKTWVQLHNTRCRYVRSITCQIGVNFPAAEAHCAAQICTLHASLSVWPDKRAYHIRHTLSLYHRSKLSIHASTGDLFWVASSYSSRLFGCCSEWPCIIVANNSLFVYACLGIYKPSIGLPKLVTNTTVIWLIRFLNFGASWPIHLCVILLSCTTFVNISLHHVQSHFACKYLGKECLC